MSVSHRPEEHQTGRLKFAAYRIPERAAYPKIVRAAADRFWMDTTTQGWANRCLPLRIANQAGWFILNDVDFEVTWDGSPKLEGVTFKYKGRPSLFARSMFGYGIVTWTIPYLFRTEAGYNVLARGPANLPKDGVAPLDGIVESDWLPYPFTMNWKITRPMRAVKFEKDEPICMLVPVKRGELEQFEPTIANLTSDPALQESYSAWHAARLDKVRSSPQTREQNAPRSKIQGYYIRGEGMLGEKAAEHQNKLDLANFAEMEPAPVSDAPNEAGAETHRSGIWARLTRRLK